MSRYSERLDNLTQQDVQDRVEQFQRPLAHVAAAASGRSLDQMPASDLELAWAVCLTEMVDPELVLGLDEEKVKPMLRGMYRYYQEEPEKRPACPGTSSPDQRWDHLMELYQEAVQEDRRQKARRKIGRQSWDELQDYVSQDQ